MSNKPYHRREMHDNTPKREVLAGFRPRTTRSFCFGKRTQNYWRPGVALRVPLPQSRLLGLRNSLRSDSPRPQTGVGTGSQPRPQALGHGAYKFKDTGFC